MEEEKRTSRKRCVTCGEEFQALRGFEDQAECYTCRTKRSNSRWRSERRSASYQRP